MSVIFANRFLPLVCMAFLTYIFLTDPAAAQSLGGVENVLQNIVDVLTGNVARLLAILAVALIGLAWMFNLVDLRAAGMVVIGIAILFGSAEIVGLLTGSA